MNHQANIIDMKKLATNTSPFLMLLLPVFLCIGMLLVNTPATPSAEKVSAAPSFQLPTLKVLFKSLL